jgi:hypothetical protein
MTLPNFLVIGAQKSGTSWLRDRLVQHPMLYMPKNEVHFFDRDENYKKGLAWYENYFADADGHKAIGEKTPSYLWANGKGVGGHLPNVHQNIHQALPHARLIISLRNPVERALSAVNHLIRTGRISPLHRTDDLVFGSKQHLVQGQGLFERGYYYQQIQAYLQYFDPEQILILIFEEDIVEHPEVGLRKVCNFLEIDDSFEFSYLHKKSNAYRYTIVQVMRLWKSCIRSLLRKMRNCLSF